MRPVDEQRRADLVAAALDHLARHGLAGFSLRALAAELGTSARMLVHYFGTREELLSRALAEHRRRALDLLRAQARGDLAEDAARSWRLLSAPERSAHYTVMFQVLAAALTPDSRYKPIAAGVVRDWIDAVTAHLVAHGEDQATATVKATVLASGLKGIALDLLVTADHDRCAAAATMLIEALTRRPDGQVGALAGAPSRSLGARREV